MTSRGAPRTAELFSGIGGFRLAAEALGLHTVFANDMSERACLVYRDCFHDGSNVLHEGDIFDYIDSVPPHDILTGGFPCQPFSFAGKKRGLRDQRADTLDAICEILARHRPPIFVLENVRSLLTIAGGRHFAAILKRLIASGYQVEWRVFNASDLGLPQNRRRVLLFGSLATRSLPGLGTPEEWLVVASQVGSIKSARPRSFPEWGMAEGDFFRGGRPQNPRTSRSGRLRDLLEADVDATYDFTAATRRRLTESDKVNTFIDGVQVLYNQEGGRRMGYTVYGVDGVAPTLTSTTSRHYERFRVRGRYRRLTPVEYARLQGFPDEHCRAVPPNERYVLLGNAIPPPLAEVGLAAAVVALRHERQGSVNAKESLDVEVQAAR